MARRNSTRGNDQMQLTPMIDIMTTLLAVFMVTTPMMTNGLDLDLPAGEGVSSESDSAMVVSVDKNGLYYLGQTKMDLKTIIKKLVAMRAENPKISVMIAGDVFANYGAVMRVMGGLKDAGFERVTLKTRVES